MSATQVFLPYRVAAKPTNTGSPGAHLNVYQAGTTTRKPVYASNSLTTQLSNPVVADGAGRFPDVWLDNALLYKLVYTDKNGATLATYDNYVPGSPPSADALQPYQDAAEAAAAAAANSAAEAATSEANAEAAANAAQGGGGGAAPSSVADRTALAAAATTISPRYLRENGREGIFEWEETNHSADVTADTQQGIYVPPASD